MILIGQDALGGWAWMLLDRAGAMVASGEQLPDRFLAVEIATAIYRGMATRGEADIDRAMHVTFPDEIADMATRRLAA